MLGKGNLQAHAINHFLASVLSQFDDRVKSTVIKQWEKSK